MAVLTYLDFDLLIERAGDRYRARVLRSPGGEASRSFELPFSREQLQIFVLKAISLGGRRKVRRIESPEMTEIKTFGGQLFDAIFDEDVHDCLRLSLHDAQRDGAGLRIRLRLDDTVDAARPEDESAVALSDVPWEFLYDSGGPGFLCLSSGSPLVRYQDLRQPIEPIAVTPPLRLLVTICGPSDAPDLDVEHERAKVQEALGSLEDDGLITIDWMERGTLKQLQKRLRSTYHAFHFIGHGGYDERSKTGVLLFENAKGTSDPVGAEFLRTLFQNHRTLQLAVLNACEGARTDPSDPFAGVAQSLVRGGVNAVIAMQFEISDAAAIALSSEFYSALADGFPVDAALAEARTAVFTRASAVEWAIPVLYLRSPNAAIFDVAARPPPPPDVDEKEDGEGKKGSEPSPRRLPQPVHEEGEEEKEKEKITLPSKKVIFLVAAALALIVGLIVVLSAVGGGPLDGDIVFVRGDDIIAIDPATKAETPLVKGADANDFAPSLSPDQTQIVFGDGPAGAGDIFIANLDGSAPMNLTNSIWDEESADWSPDGSRIVFDRKENGNYEIYAIDVDGTGLVNLTSNEANDKRPEWSPDGNHIAFESDRFALSDIFVMNPDGGGVRRLTESGTNDGVPVWSPDGDRIAFRSDREGNGYEVWIMSATGEDEHQLTQSDGDVKAPAWSPNGNQIVYSGDTDEDGSYDLYVTDAESGETTLILGVRDSDRGPMWCCF